MAEFDVQIWRPAEELAREDYAAYWNDVEQERVKQWWVVDQDFSKMEEYLAECRLPDQLARAVELAASLGHPLRGTGVDLAAGSLWAVPQLLAHGADAVYAVEYSQHRLLELGPRVLRHYDVRPEQVTLCQGSFYDLQLADHSLDFAFMSQALHHAADVDALLREVKRVLRPTGVVLVIGEHDIDHSSTDLRNIAAALVAYTPRRLQRAVLGREIARRPLRAQSVRPVTDPVLGDHFYLLSEYELLFARAGFASSHIHDRGWPSQGFVLIPAEG